MMPLTRNPTPPIDRSAESNRVDEHVSHQKGTLLLLNQLGKKLRTNMTSSSYSSETTSTKCRTTILDQSEEYIMKILIKNVSRDCPLTPDEIEDLRNLRSQLSDEHWKFMLAKARSQKATEGASLHSATSDRGKNASAYETSDANTAVKLTEPTSSRPFRPAASSAVVPHQSDRSKCAGASDRKVFLARAVDSDNELVKGLPTVHLGHTSSNASSPDASSAIRRKKDTLMATTTTTPSPGKKEPPKDTGTGMRSPKPIQRGSSHAVAFVARSGCCAGDRKLPAGDVFVEDPSNSSVQSDSLDHTNGYVISASVTVEVEQPEEAVDEEGAATAARESETISSSMQSTAVLEEQGGAEEEYAAAGDTDTERVNGVPGSTVNVGRESGRAATAVSGSAAYYLGPSHHDVYDHGDSDSDSDGGEADLEFSFIDTAADAAAAANTASSDDAGHRNRGVDISMNTSPGDSLSIVPNNHAVNKRLGAVDMRINAASPVHSGAREANSICSIAIPGMQVFQSQSCSDEAPRAMLSDSYDDGMWMRKRGSVHKCTNTAFTTASSSTVAVRPSSASRNRGSSSVQRVSCFAGSSSSSIAVATNQASRRSSSGGRASEAAAASSVRSRSRDSASACKFRVSSETIEGDINSRYSWGGKVYENGLGSEARLCIVRGLQKTKPDFPIKVHPESNSIDVLWAEPRYRQQLQSQVQFESINTNKSGGGAPIRAAPLRRERFTFDEVFIAESNIDRLTTLFKFRIRRALNNNRRNMIIALATPQCFHVDSSGIGAGIDKGHKSRGAAYQEDKKSSRSARSTSSTIEPPIELLLGTEGGAGLLSTAVAELFSYLHDLDLPLEVRGQKKNITPSTHGTHGHGTPAAVIIDKPSQRIENVAVGSSTMDANSLLPPRLSRSVDVLRGRLFLSMAVVSSSVSSPSVVSDLLLKRSDASSSHKRRAPSHRNKQGSKDIAEVNLGDLTRIEVHSSTDFERVVGLVLGKRAAMRSVLRDLSGITKGKDVPLCEDQLLGLNTADVAWFGLPRPGPADPQLDVDHCKSKSNGHHHHIVVFLEVRIPYVPSTNAQAASSTSSGVQTQQTLRGTPPSSIQTSFSFVAPCGDQWHITSEDMRCLLNPGENCSFLSKTRLPLAAAISKRLELLDRQAGPTEHLNLCFLDGNVLSSGIDNNENGPAIDRCELLRDSLRMASCPF